MSPSGRNIEHSRNKAKNSDIFFLLESTWWFHRNFCAVVQIQTASMGRTVDFSIFTVKINHPWIGKYARPMDGMGML